MAKKKTPVLNSFGQTLRVRTGYDLAGWTVLEIRLRQPDETTVVTLDNTVEGVAVDGADADGVLIVVIPEAKKWAQVGEVKITGRVVKASSDLTSDPPGKVVVVAEHAN